MKISLDHGRFTFLAVSCCSLLVAVAEAQECPTGNDGEVNRMVTIPCPAVGESVVATFGFTLPEMEQSGATVSVSVKSGDSTDGYVAQWFQSCDSVPESADDVDPNSFLATKAENDQCYEGLNTADQLCFSSLVSSGDIGLYENTAGLVVFNTGGCVGSFYFSAVVSNIGNGDGTPGAITDCTDFEEACGSGGDGSSSSTIAGSWMTWAVAAITAAAGLY